MSAESLVSTLADYMGGDYLLVQLAILAATGVIFVLSVAMMILAARSAGGARRARSDAESYLRNAQNVVVEARQLSAKIERAMAARPRGESGDEKGHPVRVSARETTAEAEVEIVASKKADTASTRDLDAARESATVPSGLLRRRR